MGIVDNTSYVDYNEKRYAPKLLSKTTYNVGTVWVFDMIHMPWGCSVWPALWTRGSSGSSLRSKAADGVQKEPTGL